MISRVRILALTAWAAAQLASPVLAAESELFLSWRAPYGEPGATDAVVAACDDTARVDTLYLSFQISKLRPGLARMSGTVTFSLQAGDTLRPFWFFKRGWANSGSMYIEFPPFPDQTGPWPWLTGDGSVQYDHRSGRGRLDIFYALPPEQAMFLQPNTRYCFARVRILHRRADLEGCRQPVCVEWASARLGFATSREMDLSGGSGRFVTWNLPRGASCGSRRWDRFTRPWQPKPSGPQSRI